MGLGIEQIIEATGLTKEEIFEHMDPVCYIGRAPEQVTEFLCRDVAPILKKYADVIGTVNSELKV